MLTAIKQKRTVKRNYIHIALDANKIKALIQLEDVYKKLITDNKTEFLPIQIITHNNAQEYIFNLPIELRAFIRGVELANKLEG